MYAIGYHRMMHQLPILPNLLHFPIAKDILKLSVVACLCQLQSPNGRLFKISQALTTFRIIGQGHNFLPIHIHSLTSCGCTTVHISAATQRITVAQQTLHLISTQTIIQIASRLQDPNGRISPVRIPLLLHCANSVYKFNRGLKSNIGGLIVSFLNHTSPWLPIIFHNFFYEQSLTKLICTIGTGCLG